MHDGRTRKVDSPPPARPAPFLESHRATLTLLRGPAAGTEMELDRPRMIAGRGDTADLRIDAPSVSSEHVAFEVGPDGFGIRDLASTNGVKVNGAEVMSVDLKHGDRIVLGECELQYVVEERTRAPRAWAVDGDD